MKKKKIILINLFLIIVFVFPLTNSCEKDVYNYIPDKYKPKYQEGDTLLYSNGIVDKTYLLYRIYYYDVIFDKKYHHPYFYYYFYDLSNTIKVDNYDLGINLWSIGIYIEHFNCDLSYNNTNSFPLQINGKNYNQVYRLETTTIDSNSSSVKIVYYTYSDAIIRYITNNNDTFNLGNK